MNRRLFSAAGYCAGAIAAICALALCTGCANRGIKVVASTASATNIGDVNWEEYKIPVFSIISGPRTTVWVNKDYLALRKVHAGGSTTNETSALGIYDDRGGRTNFVELEFMGAAKE